MRQKIVANKNDDGTTIATVATAMLILLLTFIAAISSFLAPNIRSTNALLQLQFPTSQKLDLMAVNSGNPPNTNNYVQG
jgi:hypothetical protein